MSKPDFLYFVPSTRPTITQADLRSLGLAHAISEGGDPSTAGVNNGPDGKPGVICSYNAKLGFDAAKQTWRKGPEGKYFVGYWNDRKPGPEDLARKQVYPGTEIRLQDGNDWVIPRCWCNLEEMPSTLPGLLDVAEDGITPVMTVHPRFQQLNKDAFEWWRNYIGAEQSFDGARQARYAADALAVNYRVSMIEAAGLLRLWSTDDLVKICRATIEADAVDAWYEDLQKKRQATEPATPSAA